MKKAFHELTSRGKAGRLRLMARKALEQYDLKVSRIRLISNDMNGIFRIDTHGGAKYILRVALPAGGHNIAKLRSEMIWLQALAQDTQLSIPQPLAARDGRWVIEVAVEGVPEPRLCMIFGWVPGGDLANHISVVNMTKLGRLSAELHVHAAGFESPPSFDILRFDKVFPFPEPVVLFDDTHSHLFPDGRREIYRQAVDWAQSAIDALQAAGEPMRVIHGDLHQWNVRWYRGLLSPIDFEDMMWGWPVQDIAVTLYHLWQHPQYPALRQAFQRGYQTHSLWPERYPGEIDAFIAARAAGMVNFVIQNNDPAWEIDLVEYSEKVERQLRALLDQRH